MRARPKLRGSRNQTLLNLNPASIQPSVKTDWSMDRPVTLRDGRYSADQRVEPGGIQWLRPGLRKYSCQLTFDLNTVNSEIKLSDNNRTATQREEEVVVLLLLFSLRFSSEKEQS
ncbi:stonustoxin subunit beta-like protein [Lates japonicus]|uniref:Stonustoxin subunit beta-like protein n=1 Tax=Lates japonicus TaxID=270547 RepID=A0AAD3R5S9_LATJO|nr:stonustoxin subunit beta-like protein [Lates japonicus]